MQDKKKTLKPAPPCVLIIFGIGGDLTKRLLYPAICNLGSTGLLDKNFHILGVATKPRTTESFRETLAQDVEEYITDPKAKNYGLALINNIYYLPGDFTDAQTYIKLKEELAILTSQGASQNYLFYFACPPQYFATIAIHLSKVQLLSEEGGHFRRVIVEKPFGHDLASAKELNQQLHCVAREDQIFRIDHFLGKETVQNIFSFRFSNDIFEPIWNRRYIDNVQITVAEVLGVEARGKYYDSVGALRDMVPNHLFQVLSFIAMEPPAAFTTRYIQDEKIKVLHAIRRMTATDVLKFTVRGQYGPGSLDSGDVPAYRSELNVNPKSTIETYAALELYLDNWRWLNVPFYLRTGKRMKKRSSTVVIQFKSCGSHLFNKTQKVHPDILRINIQPDEGISLRFNAKIPGPSMELEPVTMKFKYSDFFGVKPRTGYETILYDCMNGENLLFNTAEMTEAGWEVVQPILDVWSQTPPLNFPNYNSGTWGPKEADDLIHKDNRRWQR